MALVVESFSRQQSECWEYLEGGAPGPCPLCVFVSLLFPSVVLAHAIGAGGLPVLAKVVQWYWAVCSWVIWVEELASRHIVSSDKLVLAQDPFVPAVVKGQESVLEGPAGW